MAKKPKKPLSIRECKAVGKARVREQWYAVWPIFLVEFGISFLALIPNRLRSLLEHLELLTTPTEGVLILLNLLLVAFVSSVLFFGVIVVAMKLFAAKPVSVKTLFCGFRRYSKTMGLYVTNSLLIALWMLLLIVPGIIKGYAYSMSYYILVENPDMSIRDARRESVRMMKGHKWQLFLLDLSFIGWNLLAVLTCGVLYIWLTPYYKTTTAQFYQSIKDHQSPRGNSTVDHWD